MGRHGHHCIQRSRSLRRARGLSRLRTASIVPLVHQPQIPTREDFVKSETRESPMPSFRCVPHSLVLQLFYCQQAYACDASLLSGWWLCTAHVHAMRIPCRCAIFVKNSPSHLKQKGVGFQLVVRWLQAAACYWNSGLHVVALASCSRHSRPGLLPWLALQNDHYAIA